MAEGMGLMSNLLQHKCLKYIKTQAVEAGSVYIAG